MTRSVILHKTLSHLYAVRWWQFAGHWWHWRRDAQFAPEGLPFLAFVVIRRQHRNNSSARLIIGKGLFGAIRLPWDAAAPHALSGHRWNGRGSVGGIRLRHVGWTVPTWSATAFPLLQPLKGYSTSKRKQKTGNAASAVRNSNVLLRLLLVNKIRLLLLRNARELFMGAVSTKRIRPDKSAAAHFVAASHTTT